MAYSRSVALLLVAALVVGSAQALMPHITASMYDMRVTAQRAAMAEVHGDAPMPPAYYHDAMLDNFDATNHKMWQQRYFVNDTFWTDKENGPVFLFIEGEGSASPFDVLYGEHMALAAKHGALVFAVEHRYYGHSNPVDSLSNENMQYLSSEQALADLSVFYTFATQKWNLSSSNTWICYGGSYPGALSSWFRLKYPHIVYGAVASSAPVNAVENFEGYMNVVTASLNASIVGGSPECVANVQAAMASIDMQITTPAGLKTVTTQFNTCNPVTTPEDTLTFVANLAGYFQGTVQYNAELPGAPTIDSVCTIMTASGASKDPVSALVKVSALYTHGKCMDNSYKDANAAIFNTTVDPMQEGVGIRQWIWQTCTQFGFYQTCDPKTQCIFSHLLTLESNTVLCQDAYDISDTEIAARIAFTQGYYGAKDPDSSRVLFVNGSIDPWHWLSVLSAEGEDKAVFIDGTAHCANMMPARSNDPENLVKAREQIATVVAGWISDAAAAHQQ